MTDDRKNLKVPPDVFTELDTERDMPWPAYLRYLRRMATVAEEIGE